MAFKVAFDVNGSLRAISGISEVKIGSTYLRCMSNVTGSDNQLAAMIPLGSIEYVLHEELTVSDSS